MSFGGQTHFAGSLRIDDTGFTNGKLNLAPHHVVSGIADRLLDTAILASTISSSATSNEFLAIPEAGSRGEQLFAQWHDALISVLVSPQET